MARVAEQADRRGVQQGAGLVDKPSFRGDLWEWRYRPSLDLSPWIDRPTTTTSLERLDAECGEPLRELGFAKTATAGGALLGRIARGVLSGPATPPSSAA